MTDPIRELFAKHKVELDRDDLWAVQSKPVVRHAAVERLGAALGIQWLPPTIIRAERDEAVILATGKLGERMEWSIGEAWVNQNYTVTGKQKPYVFAMSEKRARDRVILKLAGLQGVYSEEEADDFKQRAPEPANERERAMPPPTNDSRAIYVKQSLEKIQAFNDPDELAGWLDASAEEVWPDFGITQHDPDGSKILMACKKRRLELKGQPPKDARAA